MVKKGLVKLQLHSFESTRIKDVVCKVKVKAADVQVLAEVPSKEETNDLWHYLPNSDKLILEMFGKSEEIGYFQLPMKKIYEFPLKKHLVEIHCITKDTVQNTIKTDLFGSLKVSLVFLQNWVGKFDVLIDRVELVEEQLGTVERELFVECTVGNVASQTTLKKAQEMVWFEFKELLPFTLESIPGKVEITIKDKDMVNDQVMGRLELNPQKESLFEEVKAKKEQRYDLSSDKLKLVLYCQSSFKLKQSL